VAITARTIEVSNSQYGLILSEGAIRYTPIMSGALIGYACCSTDVQALTAQRQRLAELGVADRISLDHGLTGANRMRPGLHQAFAAVRADDTLGMPELDRLTRSVPYARSTTSGLPATSDCLSAAATPGVLHG
jgi:hypothetical protein